MPIGTSNVSAKGVGAPVNASPGPAVTHLDHPDLTVESKRGIGRTTMGKRTREMPKGG